MSAPRFSHEKLVEITKHMNFVVAKHWIAKTKHIPKDITYYENVIREIFSDFKNGPILDPFRWYNSDTIELVKQIDPECFVLPISGSHVILTSLLSWDDCDPVYD